MATIVPIRGKYLTPKGDPATGTVSLALSTVVKDTVAKITYEPVLVVVPLAVDGTVELDVIALAGDSHLTPSDAAYTITESIAGAPARSWVFTVNVSDYPAGINIGDLAPSQAGPQLFQYALVTDLTAGLSTKLTIGSNLADLASAPTARSNLGLGGAAILNVGTTAGSVAAGDDSRITGAAQKASNLSDLASATTARSNLGAKAPDIQTFTATGTWTKPSGAKTVEVMLIGGGSGGASGSRQAAGVVAGGGGGGAGGMFVTRSFQAADLSATETVTIGTGGAGGAAVTVDTTGGNAGTQGTSTQFGTRCSAQPGSPGNGGTTTGGTASVSGIGVTNMLCGSGAAGGTGAAGGGLNNPSTLGASGGAGGGGISAGNTAFNGGGAAGSYLGNSTGGGGGNAGVVDTTPPTGGTAPTAAGSPGPGGAGGAASVTTAAQAGSTPAGFGGGGGGGGASRNGNSSGAGGAGAPGYALVTTYF